MEPTPDLRGLSKVKRLLGCLGRALRDRRGLINTTDLLVASGATIILAAGVAAASLQGLDQAKLGKAQPDAQALAAAINQFFKDTGKWPGQADHGAGAGPGAVKPLFLVTSGLTGSEFTATGVAVPDVPASGTGSNAFKVTSTSCKGNSLEGFVNATIETGSVDQNATSGGATLSNATLRNINDYLVNKPDNAKYPNWKGPYIQGAITADPWDKAWVINLMPLYCSEDIALAASSGGNLGYGWVLSGGSNRTLTTEFTEAKLDPDGDDAGLALAKLVKRGTGGQEN